MAFFILTRFRTSSMALIWCRSQKYTMSNQTILYFSSSKQKAKNDTPVKFSTNKASKITIAELITPKKVEPSQLWYERYVILLSVTIFMGYFLVFREENYIDEILKGNTEYTKNSVGELIKLKHQLIYCESKKLPTTALRNKIKILEEELNAKKSSKILTV